MPERPNFQTKKDLSNYLRNFGIPVKRWGRGSAKTVGHLLKEINSGETILTQRGKELLRRVRFSAVLVTYQDGRGAYELVEDRQEFRGGRSRRRNTGSSVCEKIQPKETPRKAAERGLREELEIHAKVMGGKKMEEIKESPSYPGLKTHYLRYDFNVKLKLEQFPPYIERQKDKTTYFVWRKKCSPKITKIRAHKK